MRPKLHCRSGGQKLARNTEALHIFARRQPALQLTHACVFLMPELTRHTSRREESAGRISSRVLKSPQTHRPSSIFLIMFDGASLKMKRHKSADMKSPSFYIGVFLCQKKNRVSSCKCGTIWDHDNEVAHMFYVSFLKAPLMVWLSRLAKRDVGSVD